MRGVARLHPRVGGVWMLTRALHRLAVLLAVCAYAATYRSLTLCGILAALAGLCWIAGDLLRAAATSLDVHYQTVPRDDFAEWERELNNTNHPGGQQ